MIFHVVDPATGAEVEPDGRPLVAFVPPELCGWWAMAPLSSKLPQGHLAVLGNWDGWGEAAGRPFGGVAAEAASLVAWCEANADGPLAALVGCGMGGQAAVEAVFSRPRVASAVLACDVLCREVPGSAMSARLTGLAWRMMGGPSKVGAGNSEKAIERVRRRRRYAASQMDGFAIPRAYLSSFAADVAVTPAATAEAMVAAVDSWCVPAGAAPGCRSIVAVDGLVSRPYRDSADDLSRALGVPAPDVARDLSRNELLLRYPERGYEVLSRLLPRE